jgi:hypothetical protein
MYSNSNQLPTLPDTLARLGLHRDRLGCIMLDIGPLIPAGLIPEEALYTSANPDRHWIRGAVGVDGAHVTLKYGLDPRLTPADVDSVLDGWSEPETIGFADLELFESPYEDDPYTCIVVRVHETDILEAHDRLSALPHIDTFPVWKPHATIAYVHPEWADRVVALVNAYLDEHDEAQTTGLDYGDTIGRPDSARESELDKLHALLGRSARVRGVGLTPGILSYADMPRDFPVDTSGRITGISADGGDFVNIGFEGQSNRHVKLDTLRVDAAPWADAPPLRHGITRSLDISDLPVVDGQLSDTTLEDLTGPRTRHLVTSRTPDRYASRPPAGTRVTVVTNDDPQPAGRGVVTEDRQPADVQRVRVRWDDGITSAVRCENLRPEPTTRAAR